MYDHQWRQRICSAVWKLLVVSIAISITSGQVRFVCGNSTTTFTNNQESHNPAPARVLACGSRLKLEIKSICTSNKETNNNGQAYYSPGFPEILKPRRKEESEGTPERRPEGNLLRKIVNRVPRGVIDECCRKPCDRQSLLKYCASFEKSQTRESSSVSIQLQSAETVEQVDQNSGKVRNPSVILPLLIQLLWDWESWEKPSANILNYHPQKLLRIVRNRSHKNCSRGRNISARDTNGNRLVKSNTNVFSRSRHSMASDETRRDSQVSDELTDEFVIPFFNSSPLETLAETVTDEPLPHVFPISAGTNANDYTD